MLVIKVVELYSVCKDTTLSVNFKKKKNEEKLKPLTFLHFPPNRTKRTDEIP